MLWAIARDWPRRSAAIVGRAPRVSVKNTIGSPQRWAACIIRTPYSKSSGPGLAGRLPT